MAAARKIIIDTDPGQDDALAILLALGSPELDVLGITAVAGNVPLALTEKNARKICELAGKPGRRSSRAQAARWSAIWSPLNMFTAAPDSMARTCPNLKCPCRNSMRSISSLRP